MVSNKRKSHFNPSSFQNINVSEQEISQHYCPVKFFSMCASYSEFTLLACVNNNFSNLLDEN